MCIKHYRKWLEGFRIGNDTHNVHTYKQNNKCTFATSKQNASELKLVVLNWSSPNKCNGIEIGKYHFCGLYPINAWAVSSMKEMC